MAAASSPTVPGLPIVVMFLGVAAVLAVGGFFWARWWRRRRPRALAGESTCGKCGYVVTTLPTFTCPECGSDLREVGIVSPLTRGLWLHRLKSVGRATADVLRGLWLVLSLRPPVTPVRVTIEARGDGRVTLDPSVTLPPGRHRAVLVIENRKVGEPDTPRAGPGPDCGVA